MSLDRIYEIASRGMPGPAVADDEESFPHRSRDRAPPLPCSRDLLALLSPPSCRAPARPAYRTTIGPRIWVIRDVATIPSFDHLQDFERNAVLAHVRSPESDVEDPPSTEVDYVFEGALRIRDHEGLPGNAPPWGTLSSIDLATGELGWQVPLGDYPQMEAQGFGAENYGGPVVTAAGLIFIGATPDRKFRAYDVRDGEVLWEAELSAAGYATPAIYSVDGRQYVVIAAGGGRRGPPSGSEYVAFSLPKSVEARPRAGLGDRALLEASIVLTVLVDEGCDALGSAMESAETARRCPEGR